MRTADPREAILEWYDENRLHSRRLFDSIPPEAYYDQPIPLRHPIVFYEGHLAAFNVIVLVRRALRRRGIDDRLESLFERGIDPETPDDVAPVSWPDRATVRGYAEEADALVRRTLEEAPLDQAGNPHLAGAQAVWAILEHEAMHHETMRYIIHRLPYGKRPAPAAGSAGQGPTGGFETPDGRTVRIPPGGATLGARRGSLPFGWDNEFPALSVTVGGFEIEAHSVTNGRYLEFVEAGGYESRDLWSAEGWQWLRGTGRRHPLFWEAGEEGWLWRGMHERLSLPMDWPVYVTLAEATAYARWRGGRLPSEAEYHRAAFGAPEGGERRFPWGDEAPDATRGNFDFAREDPAPAGSHPRGRSAWGVHDLVGNGWEWTASPFGPFPGFEPMVVYPSYSADFFDQKHFVMKGASPATSRRLVRRSFRNWFRWSYPYMYAKFRLVRSL